ncbi:MAG: hypothetical protein Q9O24_03920 [Gammaproteobacteria bacterium]|nr:hypothetical protein [Gammaproteobacteria bacterium]
MFFSSTVSFLSAAVLIPVGLYAINRASDWDKRYMALAGLPLVFGIQQALEGQIWLELALGPLLEPTTAVYGYLFFSHLFWLFWIPHAVYQLETDFARREEFLLLSLLGLLFGLSLYMPMFLRDDWLQVMVVEGNIVYQTQLLYDAYFSQLWVYAIYCAIVLLPLLGASDQEVKRFGYMVTGAALFVLLAYNYALISLWGFLVALLSLYVARIVYGEAAEQEALPSR